MIYRNTTRRFTVLALLLALALFGISPFKSGASAPAVATPPPSSVAGSPVTDEQTRARAAESFGKLPLYFVENRGQLDKRVGYYVQGSDKTIYFTNQGLTFLLNGKSEAHSEISKSDKQQSERWALKLDFVGARAGARPEGKEQTEATFSYFKGKRSQWQTGLKSYSQIVYRELWPGIDLVYAGTVNRMKYSFVVKPGADPNRIKLAWSGASGVKLNAAGELEVSTPAGGFTDEHPVSFQETNGKQVEVTTTYRLEDRGSRIENGFAQSAIAYGFEVGKYDRSRELVIDPAMLVYCGYIGGSNSDRGLDIAVDAAGNAYVTGITRSTEATFPETVGPDLTYNGGFDDAFVAKVNASGTALIYCGYIGGSDFDEGYSIDVDSVGNAYVTGETGSTEADFPVTVGPDLTSNGGVDVFVTKVNASGTALDYCGYVGGSRTDEAFGIAVDSTGNAYVAGITRSTEADFPVTVGPDLTYNGGSRDAYVAKVNVSGTALLYCGYIGGTGLDEGFDVAVDSAGNAYVTGDTDSNEASFPVTVGPDLTYNDAGIFDAYVAKVNANGTALVYCGYIGGANFDSAIGIAVDSSGNAYVAGETNTTEASFPVIGGPDLTFNGGGSDGFVAKVNASGTALNYCGYVGGSGQDLAFAIAVDSAGKAYLTGFTQSTEASFPVTGGPDLTFNGETDAFVVKVNGSGSALVYGSYIGGSDSDQGLGVAVDSSGNAYVTGNTRSTEADFPVTAGPDLTYNGGTDAFVAKISTPDNCSTDALYSVITGPQGTRNNFTGTVGSKFTVGANALVDKLGFEDQLVNGLASSHQVGLWNSSGILLASVTVQSGTGSVLIGNWRYETLPTPVTLTAGATYIVGAQVTNGGDKWTDNGNFPIEFAINQGFSLGSPPNVFTTSSFAFQTWTVRLPHFVGLRLTCSSRSARLNCSVRRCRI